MRHDQYVQRINEALEELLPEVGLGTPSVGEIPGLLSDTMRYSLLSGGKRLRPSMMLAAVELLGGDLTEAMPYACALEMIHCCSLIHDDLPGMDDDVLRRGRPTNHVIYGEGPAILAGDALLNYAYETMLSAALEHPERQSCHLQAIAEIARGAGVRGLIAGQSMDLELERKPGGGKLPQLQFIHENKTAALFVYGLRGAARLCDASEEQLLALERYGRAFGLLFQTMDDLLDVEGDPQTLGKSVGRDEERGKLTAVKVYGLGGARMLLNQFLGEGLEALAVFGGEGGFLASLIKSAALREY